MDTAGEVALSLPGVEEGTSWRSPSFIVNDKIMLCVAIHPSSEPDSLVLNKFAFEERDAMMSDDPETYYLTDHYVNYPVVLVRLKKVRRDVLRTLIQTSWRRTAPKRLVAEFDRNRSLTYWRIQTRLRTCCPAMATTN